VTNRNSYDDYLRIRQLTTKKLKTFWISSYDKITIHLYNLDIDTIETNFLDKSIL
jgi:hypothetical protein